MARRYLDPENLPVLADVLEEWRGAKAVLSVNVRVSELEKLPPAQCRAFLQGVAEIIAASPEVEMVDEREC